MAGLTLGLVRGTVGARCRYACGMTNDRGFLVREEVGKELIRRDGVRGWILELVGGTVGSWFVRTVGAIQVAEL